MKIGIRTRLRTDSIDRYEAAHRQVPEEVVAAVRQAGFREWHIFRDGPDLFHCIEVDDYEAAIAALSQVPANIAWQSRMAPLTEVAHDQSGATRDAMHLVWDLSW
jgi:L-rhamnose mutarotase